MSPYHESLLTFASLLIQVLAKVLGIMRLSMYLSSRLMSVQHGLHIITLTGKQLAPKAVVRKEMLNSANTHISCVHVMDVIACFILATHTTHTNSTYQACTHHCDNIYKITSFSPCKCRRSDESICAAAKLVNIDESLAILLHSRSILTNITVAIILRAHSAWEPARRQPRPSGLQTALAPTQNVVLWSPVRERAIARTGA